MTTEPNTLHSRRALVYAGCKSERTAGCLLCLRYFKNEHGVSIHVGKIHNKPVSRRGAEVAEKGLTSNLESKII